MPEIAIIPIFYFVEVSGRNAACYVASLLLWKLSVFIVRDIGRQVNVPCGKVRSCLLVAVSAAFVCVFKFQDGVYLMSDRRTWHWFVVAGLLLLLLLLLLLFLFLFLFHDISVCGYCHIYQCACFLFFVFNYIWLLFLLYHYYHHHLGFISSRSLHVLTVRYCQFPITFKVHVHTYIHTYIEGKCVKVSNCAKVNELEGWE